MTDRFVPTPHGGGRFTAYRCWPSPPTVFAEIWGDLGHFLPTETTAAYRFVLFLSLSFQAQTCSTRYSFKPVLVFSLPRRVAPANMRRSLSREGTYQLTDAGVLELLRGCPRLTGLELSANSRITLKALEKMVDKERPIGMALTTLSLVGTQILLVCCSATAFLLAFCRKMVLYLIEINRRVLTNLCSEGEEFFCSDVL